MVPGVSMMKNACNSKTHCQIWNLNSNFNSDLNKNLILKKVLKFYQKSEYKIFT